MTDAEVKVNGKLAGPVHQGAFYRFKYNITDKLLAGKPNLLEVTVSKISADESVNNAETAGRLLGIRRHLPPGIPRSSSERIYRSYQPSTPKPMAALR